jgi:hypothetical protein
MRCRLQKTTGPMARHISVELLLLGKLGRIIKQGKENEIFIAYDANSKYQFRNFCATTQ